MVYGPYDCSTWILPISVLVLRDTNLSAMAVIPAGITPTSGVR